MKLMGYLSTRYRIMEQALLLRKHLCLKWVMSFLGVRSLWVSEKSLLWLYSMVSSC
jgi:hypothetical protein